MAARPGDLERVQQQVVGGDRPLRVGDAELGGRGAVRAPHDHVHRLAPGAPAHEELLGDRHQLGLRAPGLVGLVDGPEAGLVDRHALAHELELLVALDRARDVEGDLEVEQLERALGERAVVAHGHHVVEAVDGEPADALRAQVVADPCPGMLGEDRVVDPAVGVVADPARLAREDRDRDRRRAGSST